MVTFDKAELWSHQRALRSRVFPGGLDSTVQLSFNATAAQGEGVLASLYRCLGMLKMTDQRVKQKRVPVALVASNQDGGTP